MKHSPFAFFRKHQRVGMVILTVMAMFAFVFLDQTFRGLGNGSRASTVAVKIKGGNLTYDQLGQLISQRVAANRFIEATARAIMEDFPKDEQAQMDARGLGSQFFGQGFPGDPESETNVMYGHVMRLEAKRMGMVVNDYTVEAYISRLLKHHISADRYKEILKKIKLSEKHLYDVFREEILAKMALTALFPRVSQTPEQYWEYYKRLKIQQNLEIAAIPVQEFTKSIPDPSDRELESMFNEYKTRFANSGPDYWKPGFRQPTKVRMQYLTTSYLSVEEKVASGKDKYTKPITDKDIVEYYEKNKTSLYKELEIDDPKDGAGKKEDRPLDPLITPEATPEKSAPAKSDPGKPASEQPKESKPGEKPAAKPVEPATEKPAEPKTEKPVEKTEAKPEAKPEVKPEAKSEDKATEKATETGESAKPADAAEKKPCGADPISGQDQADAKKPDAEKPADPKAEEPKAEEAKPAGEKPATEKPTTEPAKPATEKPADPKSEEKKSDSKATPETEKPKTDGDKPAAETGKAPDAKIPPPKFKPLTDELKEEIRDGLEKARTLESLTKLGEAAKVQLERDQLKFAYGPSISGKTVYIDFNENGQYDEGEPAVESEKKLDPTDETKIPADVMASLKANLFEQTKAEMTKVGVKLGLQYVETDLISLRDLDENPNLRSLSKVVDINDNPFQPNEAGKIQQELFGTEGRFHVHVGKDDETRLYVYWKTEHVKEHIAKFSDPGIKEEVLAAWKLLKAYPEAQKRAEELVQAAKGKKDLHDAFKGMKVSDDEKSLNLDVHETGDFTWMSTGLPSPQMMRPSELKLSHVEWTEDKINEEFMRAACEDLAVGEVGSAPNRDHSVIFIMRVVNRGAKSGEDIAKLRETFMKEQLFDTFLNIPAQYRHMFPPPPYAQMASQEDGQLYYDWLESLKKQYQITWTEELKNY